VKPTLFIEPEGTLLVNGENPDGFLDASIAPYARTFMQWATKHFQVRWLTDRAPSHAFHLAEKLGIPGHEIPFASHHDTKADAISPNSNFYWIDSRLSPMDISWLAQHGNAEKVLGVLDPDGVSVNHQKWLADKINQKRK